MKTKKFKLYSLALITTLLFLPNNIYASETKPNEKSFNVDDFETTNQPKNETFDVDDFTTEQKEDITKQEEEKEVFTEEQKSDKLSDSYFDYIPDGTYELGDSYVLNVESSYIGKSWTGKPYGFFPVTTIKDKAGNIIETFDGISDSLPFNKMDDGSVNFSYKNKEKGISFAGKVNNENVLVTATTTSNIVDGTTTNINTSKIENGIVVESISKRTDKDALTQTTTTTKNGKTSSVINLIDKNGTIGKIIQEEKVNQDGIQETYIYDWSKNTIKVTSTSSNGDTMKKLTILQKERATAGAEIFSEGIGIEVYETVNGETKKINYVTYKKDNLDIEDGSNVFSTKEIIKTIKSKTDNQSIADVLASINQNISQTSIIDLLNSNVSEQEIQSFYDEKAHQFNVLYNLLEKANSYDFNSSTIYADKEMEIVYQNILENKDQIESMINSMGYDLNQYLLSMGLEIGEMANEFVEPIETPIPIEDNLIGTAIDNGNDPTNGGSDLDTNAPTNVLEDEIANELPQETLEQAQETLDKITPIPTTTENKTDTTKEEQDNLDKIIKSAIDEVANLEELKYNEESFTKNGLSQRNGEMITGLNWRYYIQTDLKIVSEVTDYSIYGLSGVLSSSINESNDGLGSKTLYSYVYDIDGKILKDSVAKSTQTAFCTISQEDVDLAFIRILGKGNETNYNTAGYVNVVLDGTEKEDSKTSYKILVSGSRAKNDTETTVTLNAESSKPIPDSIKSICKKLMDTMYETNVASFGIDKAGTITVSTEQNDYKVIPTTGSGKYIYFDEISDSGYRKTWSYCQDQILITKEGIQYTINDVLNYDMYSVSDLINHGFVCKLNGQVATSEQAKDIIVKPSDIKNGQETDTSGKLKDNDSDIVTPTNGDKQKPIAVLDGSNKVDLSKAYSEYIYSSNNYDYFIPEGINENTKILFVDEKGTQTKLTVAEALAQKYMNADQFVSAMGEIGVEVVKIGKTTTTPDFQLSIKEDSSADTIITEIFRDDKYIYSLASSSLEDRIVVLTADGRKLRIGYVLDNNMYTIAQLEQKGLSVYKSLIINEEETEDIGTPPIDESSSEEQQTTIVEDDTTSSENNDTIETSTNEN